MSTVNISSLAGMAPRSWNRRLAYFCGVFSILILALAITSVQFLKNVWIRIPLSLLLIAFALSITLISPSVWPMLKRLFRRKNAAKEFLPRVDLLELCFFKAFEEAAIGMALVSIDGRFLRVNQALCNLVGYTKQNLESLTFEQITHPADIEQDLTFVQQLLKGEIATYQMEKRYVHKCGWIIWAHLSVSLIRDEDAKAQYFVAQIQDITERKRAVEQLRQSEEMFCRAFRSCPLAITISTLAEGRYIDANDAFVRMMGYQRGEMAGRTAFELNIWDDPYDRETMRLELVQTGRISGFETILNSKSGPRRVQLFAERVELEGTECLLAITHDITDTKQLEAQFHQAQKMEALGLLAEGVAHDFNNMLGIIHGYSDLAMDRASLRAVRRDIDQIKKATDRAAGLSRKLLAFGRQQIVRPSVINLNTVINDLSQMMRRVLPRSIDLIFNPACSLDNMKADLGQIEQILVNLLLNAHDAMPCGGQITIETANVEVDQEHSVLFPEIGYGRHVALSVSDTGCGMDEQTMSRIFQPFFTTKSPDKGSGLGLSMVYSAVKDNHGQIFVLSQPGVGTTFQLYFPRVEEIAVSRATRPRITSTHVSQTVLVVEDEAALRRLLVEILESDGYRVLEAAGSRSAAEISERYQGRIHVLLTDVGVASRNGSGLVPRLLRARPDLKVLYMSGHIADAALSQRLISEKASIVEKPFTRFSLLHELHAILESKEKQSDPTSPTRFPAACTSS